MTASTIRAVAFDLMDTVVRDPWKAGLRAAFGDRLEAAMKERDTNTWPLFETGQMTEQEFWAAHDRHAPDAAACRKVRIEQTAWLPGMRELVAEVRDAGIRVALASNYPSWFEDIEAIVADSFDHVVVSYRIGTRKPDHRFYDAVARAVEAPHSDVLFLDDRPANVEAAVNAGMVAFMFTDATSARQQMRDLGVPV